MKNSTSNVGLIIINNVLDLRVLIAYTTQHIISYTMIRELLTHLPAMIKADNADEYCITFYLLLLGFIYRTDKM